MRIKITTTIKSSTKSGVDFLMCFVTGVSQELTWVLGIAGDFCFFS